MTTNRWAKRAVCILCFVVGSSSFGAGRQQGGTGKSWRLCGEASAQHAGAAPAPSQDDLKAARELFAEAYKDEQEKRYEQALEKFTRVAKVRESASVRYRIASVLEALGRLREARDAFRALAAKRNDLEKKEQEIADSSAERAAMLDKRIPKLVIRTDRDPHRDARVTVDGGAVPASTQPRAIELDPGDHVVHASAPGARDFETKVKLAEGGEIAIVVPVESGTAEKPPPPNPPGGDVVTPPPEGSNRSLAYIAVGAGSILFIAGIVFLVARENDISDVNRKCPSGVCNPSQRNIIESDRDQAKLFGPLGVGFMVAGLAAGGFGVYLLTKPSSPPSSPPSGSPTSPPAGAVRIAPHPVRGGGVLAVGASF